MANPLFSTYSQGENRVTASILAVCERLSFALVEQILQALLQEPATELVTFRNQPPGPTSVPDARIRASFSYWIETKRSPQSVDPQQIRAHLKALDAERNVETQRLLILTPDTKEPDALAHISDTRVAWASFDDLLNAIQEILRFDEERIASDQTFPSERERELLRELVRFLIAERLVGHYTEQVLVVAARIALREYLKYSVYMCQPNRTFQPSSNMAFYANGRIAHRVPAIQGAVESVGLSEETVQARHDLDTDTKTCLLDLVKQLRDDRSPRFDQEAKVIFLSAPDASETIQLPHDIHNDLVSDAGRPIAFTQGQRYVPLTSLKKEPKTTSELLKLAAKPF